MRRLLIIATGAAFVALGAFHCGGFGSADARIVDASTDAVSTSPASDPNSVADHYKDGSRLKASSFVTPEGARQFRGWYDTQLGVFCDFVKHNDGKLRCVPRGTNETPLYSTAGCDESSRVVVRDECDAEPKYARRQTLIGECEPTYRVYRVGPPVSGTTYYPKSTESDACPTVATTLTRGTLHKREAEISGAELVEGTEVDWSPPTVLGATNVNVRFIEGSDGSRGFHRLRETYKGETCELKSPSTVDPTIRCVPSRTLLNADYADSLCTNAAFGSQSGTSCARPQFGKAFLKSADACQDIEEYHVLSPSPSPSAFRKTADGCQALELDAGAFATTYFTGTPYGLANFSPAVLAPLRSDARIDRWQYVLPDGTRVPRGFADFGRWRDQKRNEDCELRLAADGKVRCLPVVQASVSFVAKYFSDQGCTSPLSIANLHSCEKLPRVVAVSGACPGPPVTHVHAIGAQVNTPVYRIARAGAPCTLVTPDPNKPNYYIGAEIPPTELVEVTPTSP